MEIGVSGESAEYQQQEMMCEEAEEAEEFKFDGMAGSSFERNQDFGSMQMAPQFMMQEESMPRF